MFTILFNFFKTKNENKSQKFLERNVNKIFWGFLEEKILIQNLHKFFSSKNPQKNLINKISENLHEISFSEDFKKDLAPRNFGYFGLEAIFIR